MTWTLYSRVFARLLDMCIITLSLSYFTATPATQIYSLSLHDALPIYDRVTMVGMAGTQGRCSGRTPGVGTRRSHLLDRDRKSTRLNSSHSSISYAVFCLKKKNALPSRAARRRLDLC